MKYSLVAILAFAAGYMLGWFDGARHERPTPPSKVTPRDSND